MTLKHILVVDDDSAMRDMIREYLEAQGFRVSSTADGRGLHYVLAEKTVDLVILDLKLANENGLDIMRGLSDRADLPIIVITGHRREETDRVVGLELGADDYIIKPFGLRELLARIRAVLRRMEAGERSTRRKEKRARYRFAGWELNLLGRQLTSPRGEVTPLTAGEFNLLVAFLRAPKRVLSREQLLEASRVRGEEVYDRSIDVQILRLRRKLEADPSQPKLIRTERGAGYVLVAHVETA